MENENVLGGEGSGEKEDVMWGLRCDDMIEFSVFVYR